MKLYLSSTFADLREHRAAVDVALRRMGHDVIGMEQYVAENTTPLDRCLADVRSCDAYVVIVGWRYGFVPRDEAANPEDRSITHLEFLEARRSGRTVLAFLLDPEAPWPPSAFDALSAEGGQRIAGFRSELGGEYLAGVFRTPDDLASQVAAAVSTLGLNRQMAERALAQRTVTDAMRAFGGGQPLYDTTLQAVQDMIRTAGSARSLLVDLGAGDVWWSTRLYLLAVLAESLTGVRQFLFSQADGAFVGMASPTAVRDGLSAAFPVLAAFDAAVREGGSPDVEREITRCTGLWGGRMSAGEADLKVGVRPQLLAEWLGERLISRCIRVDAEPGLTLVQVQQLVDSLVRDVPVQRDRPGPAGPVPELMVVDRDAFGLELAREWVRSGLPRAPLR